jgi:hypothetical protein
LVLTILQGHKADEKGMKNEDKNIRIRYIGNFVRIKSRRETRKEHFRIQDEINKNKQQ